MFGLPELKKTKTMEFTKTTIDQLNVGDSFSWINQKYTILTVVRVECPYIFYTRNGKEYNCLYDKSPINKVAS